METAIPKIERLLRKKKKLGTDQLTFYFRSQLKQTLFVVSFVVRVERSTDQVIKPVNVEALSKWVGKIPADVVRDMAVIAPMLSRLGYDPHANPPNYGRPDPKVLDNTRRVSTNQNLNNLKRTQWSY